MKLKRFAGVAAALLLGLAIGAPAVLADDPTASANVSLTITASNEFSVQITSSTNFTNQPFNLTASGNYTGSASYVVQVVNKRGVTTGWNLNASASAFTPAIPGSGLPSVNNGLYWLSCATGIGFCSSSDAISTGVHITAGSPDLIAGPASLMYGESGTVAGPQPKATGTFSTQEAVYYTGFPVALAVGTYTTTITMTLSGVAP